jgi:hypothetical protein
LILINKITFLDTFEARENRIAKDFKSGYGDFDASERDVLASILVK